MLVKIFVMRESYLGSPAKASSNFEQEINSWLRANPDIRIANIEQSSCGGSLEPARTVVSVWYQDAATQA